VFDVEEGSCKSSPGLLSTDTAFTVAWITLIFTERYTRRGSSSPVTLHGEEFLITSTTINYYPPAYDDLDNQGYVSIRQHTKFGLTKQTACNCPTSRRLSGLSNTPYPKRSNVYQSTGQPLHGSKLATSRVSKCKTI